MRWKGPLFGVVALLLALSTTGLVVNKLWTKSLTEQASKTEAAIKTARAFERVADMAARQAQKERAEAIAHDKRAAQHIAEAAVAVAFADSLLAFAPDTCLPYITAERDARGKVQMALDEQKQATARLIGAAASDSTALAALVTGIGTATDAAQDLVDATHRSWLINLLPKVGIGVTAGITPQGKFEVAAGPTLVWTF